MTLSRRTASLLLTATSASSLRRPPRPFFVPSTAPHRPSSSLMSSPLSIPLRDGTAHPQLGFGTYKVGYVPPSASSTTNKVVSASDCISHALQCGYRFLECAEFYGNQANVGIAIQHSGIPRSHLFLCSKVWTTTIEQGEEAIRAALQQTLRDLQTTYLDLYLIHWPVPNKHVEAYLVLEKLQREGYVRNIGVSNYSIEDYQELLDGGISILPAVNQIEINPFLYRKKTIQYFQTQGVILQSYRSLRDGKAMDHPTLIRVGEKYGKTPAQILGRWCVQHGFVYMPKSVKVERMKENSQVFDFVLETEDMEELDGLTTPEALNAFQELYRKCVNRDTTKDGTLDGVKMNITID